MHTKKISRFLSLFLTIALVFSLMPTALAADTAVTGVKLSDIKIDLTVGESRTLTATVQPDGATDQAVTWTSSDDKIATVGSDGKVEAKSEGTAEITVTTHNGNYSDRCTVKVQKSATIQLKDGDVTLEKGKTKKLPVSITPTSEANRGLTWIVSRNSNVAEVDSTGTVTAKEVGTADITVCFSNDRNASATCTVTVTEPAPSLSPATLSLKVNSSGHIAITNLPGNPDITWSVNKTGVAGISSSNNSGCDVTGNSVGTATITASYSDGGTQKKITSTVSVSSTSSPTISSRNLTVAKGKTATLKISNLPTGGSVEWDTSKSSVATVSGSGTGKVTGTVKGVASSGSTTITAKVLDSSGTKVTELSCTVKIGTTSSSLDTINYSTKKETAVSFDAKKFKSVCDDYTDESLEYVKFTLPSSKYGTLYYEYTSSGKYDHKVDSDDKYYPNPSSSRYDLDEVYFVPNSSLSNDTVTIKYTAYYDDDHFTGTVKVKVGSGSSGDISYKTAKNGEVNFSATDFNTYCKDETDETFDYVKFDTDMISSSQGKLYYQYDSTSEKEAGSANYYRTGSSSKLVKDLTFVPKSGYTGTVKIDFTGYSDDSDKFTGTVEIIVGSGSSGDVTYTVAKNGKVDFSSTDFNKYCKDETDESFDYITFSSVSSSQGTLYYQYGTSDEKTAGSTKYYRSSSSSSELSDLTFVPKSGYTGDVKIDFSGMSEDDDKFSGTVVITVGGSTTVKGDVTYTSPANSPVSLSDSDFTNYCKKETSNTYNLNYVNFGSVDSSKGTLYYQYGESDQKVAGTANYYRSGTSSLLKDLTFVPKNDYTGTVEIDFTGYNTNGDKFTGTLGILFESLNDPTNITYSTGSKAVTFVNSDFVSACAKRGGDALKSVKFSLPEEGVGTLYYNYVSPTSYGGKVNSTTAYIAGTGTGSIGAVSFLPKAGYNGIATISYSGTDTGGNTFNGYVYVTVTPSTSSSKFNDMKNHTWATASVDFLSDYKVVTGTTNNTYDPGGSITRGDFILMLYRAFGFTSTSTANFKDVPADSYYAQAIAAAKALDIAQGTNNRFKPQESLTREDAMVLIQRTMEKTNRPLPSGSTATLDRFGDSGKISSYAKSAVASLVEASIVKGDDNGNFNPKSTISRAEMAVALHRVLTL